MNCSAIQEELLALLSENQEPSPQVAEHLEGCPSCQQEGLEMAAVWSLLGREANRPMPVLARLRTLARLTQGSAPDVLQLRAPEPRPQPRFRGFVPLAASLAALFLTSAMALQSFQKTEQPESLFAFLQESGRLGQLELVLEDGKPQVKVQLGSSRALLEGPPQEAEMRQLLVQVLQAAEARGSVRARAAKALAESPELDRETRGAIIQALMRDPNPSVRLKAAEALRGLVALPDVQSAFLEVLRSDPHPGLRIQAINALQEAPPLEQSDALEVLRQAAMDSQSGPYVQLKAAEMLADL